MTTFFDGCVPDEFGGTDHVVAMPDDGMVRVCRSLKAAAEIGPEALALEYQHIADEAMAGRGPEAAVTYWTGEAVPVGPDDDDVPALFFDATGGA
jgi:hypothetical protein